MTKPVLNYGTVDQQWVINESNCLITGSLAAETSTFKNWGTMNGAGFVTGSIGATSDGKGEELIHISVDNRILSFALRPKLLLHKKHSLGVAVVHKGCAAAVAYWNGKNATIKKMAGILRVRVSRFRLTSQT
jgi:hypothetical protein